MARLRLKRIFSPNRSTAAIAFGGVRNSETRSPSWLQPIRILRVHGPFPGHLAGGKAKRKNVGDRRPCHAAQNNIRLGEYEDEAYQPGRRHVSGVLRSDQAAHSAPAPAGRALRVRHRGRA